MYHMVRVKDIGFEYPTLESIPLVKDFTKVFPDEYPRIPTNRKYI